MSNTKTRLSRSHRPATVGARRRSLWRRESRRPDRAQCVILWPLSILGSFFYLLAAPYSSVAQQQRNAPNREADQVALAREQTLLFRISDAASDEEIPRLENPVLHYNDPARGDVEGTLWLWGAKGRPAAVLELFRVRGEAYDFWYGFHATAPNRITMRARTGQTWTPLSSALKFQPFDAGPPPADSATARMAQMRGLSRRFAAHEFWRNARHELRVLPAPVHRYEDAASGILDGTLFVIAHGTHPEATLFLEAFQPAGGTRPTWQFAVGRSGAAEIVVLCDEQEVYRAPAFQSFPPPTSAYWRMTSTLPAKETRP